MISGHNAFPWSFGSICFHGEVNFLKMIDDLYIMTPLGMIKRLSLPGIGVNIVCVPNGPQRVTEFCLGPDAMIIKDRIWDMSKGSTNRFYQVLNIIVYI